MEKKKNIAFVIGHTKLKKGAKGVDNIPPEWDYNGSVGEHLSDIADIYYYDSYNLGYKSMVKANADKMNKKDYDIVLELHYNYVDTPQANGSEVFYYYLNKKGKEMATRLSGMISSTFKVRDRGAKAMISSAQRGYWAVYLPKATTLLLEPFFGSNKDDVSKFKCKEKEYSELIRKFLKLYKFI